MPASLPTERHDHAGPGREFPRALRDVAHHGAIAAAADDVQPAAHALQQYDVLRALFH